MEVFSGHVGAILGPFWWSGGSEGVRRGSGGGPGEARRPKADPRRSQVPYFRAWAAHFGAIFAQGLFSLKIGSFFGSVLGLLNFQHLAPDGPKRARGAWERHPGAPCRARVGSSRLLLARLSPVDPIWAEVEPKICENSRSRDRKYVIFHWILRCLWPWPMSVRRREELQISAPI